MKKILITTVFALLNFGFSIVYADGPVAFQSTINIAQKYAGLSTTNAAFSVGSGVVVYISQGNLQYCAAPTSGPTTHATNGGGPAQGIWRFAEHQYDMIGSSNASASNSYSGWIDLFAYGCDGWNGGEACYQPWFPNSSYANASNHLQVSLTGNYANADWGVYNAISNGKDTPNLWRTLSHDEWNYLINTRQNASSKRALARVNGVNGLVLLPDTWSLPEGCSFNAAYSAFTNNTYTLSQWESMEQAGAIFLPAAGNRHGSSGVTVVGSTGYYFSTTPSPSNSMQPYSLDFHAGVIDVSYYFWSDNAHAVRLVINQDKVDLLYGLNYAVSQDYGNPLSYVELEDNVQLNITEGVDFVFSHWADDELNTSLTREVAKEDATYNAVFYKTFTVSFDMGEHADSSVDPRTDYVISASPSFEVADGYAFTGWSEDGVSTISFPYYPEADVTLHALYNFIGEGTVSFETYEHNLSSAPAALQAMGGYDVILPDVTPKDCYEFLGWSETENATSADYVAGDLLTIIQPSTTLYAVYADRPRLYTYPPSLIVEGEITVVEGDCEYTLTAIPAEGYRFYKWDDIDINNPQSTNPVRVVGYAEQDYFALFAKIWQVTFDDNGSTEVMDIDNGCEIEDMPIRPHTEELVFCGWASTENASTPDIAFPYTPTEDVTLYAVYRVKPGDVHVATAEDLIDLDILSSQAPYANLIVDNGGVLTVTEGDATQLHFAGITVNGGGKLVIPSGKHITTDQLILNGGDSIPAGNYIFRYPQLVVNGGLHVTNDTVYYDYLLNKAQQYTLSLPVNVAIDQIRYADGAPAEYGTDYKVATYNGAARAQGLTGWYYLNNPTTLNAGVGYTVFASPEFYRYHGTGTPVQAKYSRLRFPLYVGSNYAETEKTISVSAHPSTTGKVNDAGWNLLGNPYFANYNDVDGLTASSPIHMLDLLSDGSYEWITNQRYVVIPADDGRAYFSELADEVVLPAFKNFFVQIGDGDAVTLPLANRQQNVAQRRWAQEQPQESMVRILLRNSTSSDKMGVLIGEDYTEQYEINADLQKFGHNAGVNVYAWMNADELAFVAVNSDYAAGSIPVGYIAPVAGDYTFSLPELVNDDRYQFESISLYDSQTRITTNLLLDDYTFRASRGVNNTRFSLSLQQRRPIATAIPAELADAPVTGIYDVLGHRMGITTINSLPMGVYLITTDKGNYRILVH